MQPSECLKAPSSSKPLLRSPFDESFSRDKQVFAKQLSLSRTKDKSQPKSSSNSPFSNLTKRKYEDSRLGHNNSIISSRNQSFFGKPPSLKKKTVEKAAEGAQKDRMYQNCLKNYSTAFRLDSSKIETSAKSKDKSIHSLAKIKLKDRENSSHYLPRSKSIRNKDLIKITEEYIKDADSKEDRESLRSKHVQNNSLSTKKRFVPQTNENIRVQINMSIDTFSVFNLMKEQANLTLSPYRPKEFSPTEFRELLKARGIRVEHLDIELQKLLKVYIEIMQKRVPYDQLVRVLEARNFNLHPYLLAAFRKFLVRADPQRYKAKSPSKADLGLDLTGVVEAKSKEKTPKGFHQEFMEKLPEFSLSWRTQATKEAERASRHH